MIIRTLIGLMWVLAGMSAIPAQAGMISEPTIVEVEHPAHFTTAEGEDVLIVPGSYHVEKTGEMNLRLQPIDGEAKEAITLQGQATTHQEKQDKPIGLAFPGEEEDTYHVVLLFPDGQGIQVNGTYSGVKTRGLTRIQLSPLQIQQRVQLATRPTISVSPQILGQVTIQPGKDPVALQEREDVPNRIHTAVIQEGKVAQYSMISLNRLAFQKIPFPLEKPEKERPEARREKIHPLIQKWLASRRPNESEAVVVTLQENVKIPRFPEPAIFERRDSDTNKKALARVEQLINGVKAKRGDYQKKLMAEFSERYKAKPMEAFWLVNALTLHMPLGAIQELAKRGDVAYIEPDRTEDIPPQNANNSDDVQDGRARIVSDPYFNLGLTGGYIGLLDTGVRFTHRHFNSPSNIDFRRDCVNGGSNCNTGSNLNPNDDCWNHGTSSAGIITANNRDGNAFRGVTGVTLDSFKVYPSTFDANNQCNGSLSTTASVRGFERAVAVLDRVIVAEMQGSGSDTSSISVAADNAFDAGAVIIAANGNNGPNASTVNTPAKAHKVIGVGNFDVQTQNQVNSQSRGPAPDNRFKPDIQAPTNTETSSNGCAWKQNCSAAGSDTAFRVFGGTSGATPYASGVAALARNWLRGTSFSIDPGQVYAFLILAGQQPYPFNNTSGAGPLRLPTNGHAWWGKVSVGDGMTIDIPLSLSGTNLNTFDGALWWPESAAQQHNDIDLTLIRPNGTTADSSISIPSVFERAQAAGSVTSGTWKLRIRGFRVRTGAQVVYWAAHVRR